MATTLMQAQRNLTANQVMELTPVRIVLPVSKHPHLMHLLDEVDFQCSGCSEEFEIPVFRTLREAYKYPMGGPQGKTTRLMVLCARCKTAAKDSGFIHDGMVDLLAISPDYKRPKREADNRGGLFSDVELEAMEKKEPEAQAYATQGIPPQPDIELPKGMTFAYLPGKGKWMILPIPSEPQEDRGDDSDDEGRIQDQRISKKRKMTKNAKAKKKRLQNKEQAA